MAKSKVFELVSVVLGTFIGAGFVGGREVAQYFSKYGFFVFFMFFIILILFYLFIKLCLDIGRKYSSCDNINNIVYKKFNNIVNILILVTSIINVGSMIAGSYSIGNMFSMSMWKYLIPFLVIFGCFFVVKNRYDAMKKVNIIAVPLIIVAILIITIVSIINSSDITIVIADVVTTILGGISSSVIYVFFNMFLLGVLLIQIGHKYSPKEIQSSACISSIIISLLVLIVSLSITFSDGGVYSSDIPLLQECININYYFAFIFAGCQLLGVFTTIISSCFIASNIVLVKVKSHSLAILIVLGVGVLISFFGFVNIVNYLYSFTGILSIIYFVILFSCVSFKGSGIKLFNRK